MVAKVTELLDETSPTVERSTSQIPDSARRLSHNGANEPSSTSEVANSASPQQAPMVLVGALLSLLVLIVVLFIITDRLMKRSRWNTSKTTAHWRRRRATSGVAVGDGSAHLPQKDIVRLGWIPAEDFDHWSNVLLQNDTEHERLLLAVSPHQ